VLSQKGNTALHIASLAGQEDVIKILIQNGAKVNVQSQVSFSSLFVVRHVNVFLLFNCCYLAVILTLENIFLGLYCQSLE